jgi:hypothetical protein
LDKAFFDAPVADQQLAADTSGTKPSKGSVWSVEISETGDSVYLKNIDMDKYMYVPKEMFGRTSYRKVDLAPKRDEKTFRWKLKAGVVKNGLVNSILIRNMGYKQYLEWDCEFNKPPIYTTCLSFIENSWIVEKC